MRIREALRTPVFKTEAVIPSPVNAVVHSNLSPTFFLEIRIPLPVNLTAEFPSGAVKISEPSVGSVSISVPVLRMRVTIVFKIPLYRSGFLAAMPAPMEIESFCFSSSDAEVACISVIFDEAEPILICVSAGLSRFRWIEITLAETLRVSSRMTVA